MGRNCGDLAVHTALACGAEFALVPEKEWYVEDIADRIKWGVLTGKRSNIIIFAEGAFSSLKSNMQELCHKYEALKGIENDQMTSSKLAHVLEVLSGHEVRATVLGYIQRGGSPSGSDRILGSRLGARAVELLLNNRSGLAVGIRDNKLIDVPFEEITGVVRPLNSELVDLINVIAHNKE
jgi:6-phosphofructokinase 1